ncbi:class F sortase [Streptomyces sp. ISL-10]|uniref:class F sortase n=1 Tax=Streptomyces sp. ISL-10 TaxID=2819172 RepID=UPI001BE935E6|nr:class F sortase [Streptomyces sp. ISL-10]MBT2368215.1 class F sortase [Streptomyces sp. ISL-10]
MSAQPPLVQSPTTAAPRSLGRALLWPAAAVALGFMLVFNSFDTTTDAKPAVQPVASSPAAVDTPAPAAEKPGTALPRAKPKRLKIKEIAVDAPFMGLSIDSKGQLEAPPANNSNLVGWFQEGVSPGERGTAIVAGHVDTKTGPAVFLQLSVLKKGSKVDIAREDGTVATFVVDSVESFMKSNFPDKRVYADTPDAQLRLITCAGTYDKKAQDYPENLVVFAHLDSVRKG